MIKKLAKFIIPKKIISYMKTTVFYWYDIKRFTFHSNTYQKLNTPSKVKGSMTMLYHVVEKGLTMPEIRLGFGVKVVNDLIFLCNLYKTKKYDLQDLVFIHSVEVLNAYLEFHKHQNYSIDIDTITKINKLALETGIKTNAIQKEFSNSEYFKDTQSPFNKFCKSRHSVRNFIKKDIPIDTIYECIELANESPSACNRQPNRVYIVKNPIMVKDVLDLQNGNRGFGHLASTLLVLSSDISVFQNNDERNEAFLNSGLFGMTLSYALHLHKIGSCFLNWSVSKKNDANLRTLINIPDNELITVIVICGYLPERFKIASSPRMRVKEIIRERM